METRRVIVVGYDAAQLLDIACVTSALESANWHGAAPCYEVRLATPGGRPIVTDSALTLQGQVTLERVTGVIDTLIVSGGIGCENAAADPSIVAHVRRLARQSRRVASVCTGAYVLAAAGLAFTYQSDPELAYLLMAFNMSVGMAVWMRFRGHGWPATLEMCGAMFAPIVPLFPLLWLGLIDGMALMVVAHVAMFPAMLAVMLRRLDEYAGCAR